MKAKVMKAIATDRVWKDKKLWRVQMDNGIEYDCFTTDPNPLLGTEVEFEATEDEKYGWKAKIKTPGSGGGFKGGFGGFQKQAHDPSTMVLAYAKDMTIAMMVAGFIKSPTDAQKWWKDNYDLATTWLPKGDK